MNIRPLIFCYLSLLFTTLFSASLCAQNTQWELGAGLGALDFRLYPGSRQTKSYLLPLPYFTLRNHYLEIDRGIRGLLPSDSDWYLDVSADFGLPVNSDDSLLRIGMPNLDAILQFGPSLEYSIAGGRKQDREFRLEVPLRTAISVDVDQVANRGWLFEPRLVYEIRRNERSGLSAKIRAGLRYASQDYHAYYYDVAPAFVTAQRDLFSSSAGYSGLVTELSAAWRQGDVLLWGMVRYQNLSGAVFEHSSLVADNDYFFAGIGVTWIFMGSK